MPPRYAVESDEEDEFNPLSSTPDHHEATTLDVKVVAPHLARLKEKPMIVASGQLASFWATGAQLEEQIGAVFVNNVQVRVPENLRMETGTLGLICRLGCCSPRGGLPPSS